MELDDLYRDVILDHNRNPRNFGPLEPADASVEGFNPLCGDRLTVRLKMMEQTIEDIRFEGQGCAISTASASLMTEAVKGRTRGEALELFERVHELLTDDAAGSENLGKLAALSGVREFPARVKCASLCWHTLVSALQTSAPHDAPAVSTE
jgi:nitrogen fixation NifU-like protein